MAYSEESLCEICTRTKEKKYSDWNWSHRWGFDIEELSSTDLLLVEGKCDVPHCTKKPKFIINVGERSIQLCFSCTCSLHALFSFRFWRGVRK